MPRKVVYSFRLDIETVRMLKELVQLRKQEGRKPFSQGEVIRRAVRHEWEIRQAIRNAHQE